MRDKIKKYLRVFFKHIYHILQHPELLMVGLLIVYIIGCILLMFALAIFNPSSEGVEIFKTTASCGAVALIFIWLLLLLIFISIPLQSDNSSIENKSWIYDPSANKLMLSEIREHCKRSCTAEHCNNCALRKYTEEK